MRSDRGRRYSMINVKDEGALVTRIKHALGCVLAKHVPTYTARYVATEMTPAVLSMVRDAYAAGRKEGHEEARALAVKLSDGDRLGAVDIQAYVKSLQGCCERDADVHERPTEPGAAWKGARYGQ